jgi:hypothetical protein
MHIYGALCLCLCLCDCVCACMHACVVQHPSELTINRYLCGYSLVV